MVHLLQITIFIRLNLSETKNVGVDPYTPCVLWGNHRNAQYLRNFSPMREKRLGLGALQQQAQPSPHLCCPHTLNSRMSSCTSSMSSSSRPVKWTQGSSSSNSNSSARCTFLAMRSIAMGRPSARRRWLCAGVKCGACVEQVKCRVCCRICGWQRYRERGLQGGRNGRGVENAVLAVCRQRSLTGQNHTPHRHSTRRICIYAARHAKHTCFFQGSPCQRRLVSLMRPSGALQTVKQ